MKHSLSARQCTFAAALAVALGLCAFYFSPLRAEAKIAYVAAFLALTLALHCLREGTRAWWMVGGLLLSAVGDWMVARHDFLLQMGAFMLAHVAYILHFLRLRRPARRLPLLLTGTAVVALCLTVAVRVLPGVEQSIVFWGVGLYSLVISTMLLAACLTGRTGYWAGAAAFVASDFILAWNKFVAPVTDAHWWIMVPYYGAQLLLWATAWNDSKKNSKHA